MSSQRLRAVLPVASVYKRAHRLSIKKNQAECTDIADLRPQELPQSFSPRFVTLVIFPHHSDPA